MAGRGRRMDASQVDSLVFVGINQESILFSFLFHCDKYLDKQRLKEETVYLSLLSQATVYCVRR